jgi:cytochrome c-type biogenesis protein CcmH
MNTSRRLLLCLAAAAAFGACRQESQSESAPPRPTEDAGLRPLTSRDDAPAPAASAAPGEAASNPHESQTLPAGHPPIEGSGGAAAAAHAAPSVTGVVEAAPAVKGKIKGGALYVIARNAKTNHVIAARRLESSVPQKFEISGADAMPPGTPFEGPFKIIARWSQSGDAMPQPGDIEGTAVNVAAGEKNLKIVLSEVRP